MCRSFIPLFSAIAGAAKAKRAAPATRLAAPNSAAFLRDLPEDYIIGGLPGCHDVVHDHYTHRQEYSGAPNQGNFVSIGDLKNLARLLAGDLKQFPGFHSFHFEDITGAHMVCYHKTKTSGT